MRQTIRAVAVAAFLSCAGGFSVPAAAAQADPQADYPALFAELEKAEVIVEGAKDAKNMVYVFFDPNCLYCNYTWRALQPYEKVGLQVRWVPVAFQKSSSTGRAAAIMEARYRAAALRYNEMKFDSAKYEGGIHSLDQPKPDTLKKIEANTRLMERFGAPGTPVMVWKDAGGNIQYKAGLPKLSEIPRITGLPEQKITDPELARFR